MPSRNTIEVVINATDNASRVFNLLADNTKDIGKIATTAIVGGFAAATAAVTGFAVKGLQEFTSFQQGMAEVFTLIPDASQEMKDKLEKDIEGLSSSFGILPDKTIPALYQAISAGVPPDNVISFLRTASQAAIGGVTDLETAVDGITSVVNAYGSDVIDATKASDLMFTAVRLGKTNFEQLSQSLFQVIPTASSLGVSFEDVTASLAAITAQGTPTNVATTQMRQLFVELSKDAGKTSDIFKEIAGKSFKDFIASGGNTQDALKLLEKYAKDTGVGINDLFGSVEAGNAALQLTGRGTERFTDFLSQMGNATGATGDAFETMYDTIQFTFNKVVASASVLFIEIGRVISPIVIPILNAIEEIIRVLTNAVSGEYFIDTIDEVSDAVRPLAKIIMNFSKEVRRVWGILTRFFAGVNAGVPFLDNLRSVLYSLFPKNIADAIRSIIDALNNLWQGIKPIIDSIIKFVSENVELKDVLIAIGLAISSFVVPALVAIAAPIAGLIATFGLLVGAVTLFRKAWETDFLGIQTFVTEKLIPALQLLADWFLNDALPKAIAFVQNVAIPALEMFVNWLGGIWESVKPALESIAKWFIQDALPAIVNFITGVVIPGIGNFIMLLVNIWNTVKPHLENLANWFINDALPSIVSFIQNTVIPGIQSFIDLLLNIWNTVSPELSKLFDWFMTTGLPAIKNFIDTTIIPGINTLSTTITNIWTTVQPELQKLYDWFVTTGLPAVANFINQTVLPAIGELLKSLVNFWNTVSPELQKVFDWFVSGQGLKDISQAVTDFANLFSENSALIMGLGALVTLLATGGGGTGVTGLLTAFSNAIKLVWTSALPVVGAIGALALAVYGLNEAVNKFNNDIKGGMEKAGVDLAERVQAGLTSKEDIANTVFAELQRQYGDLGARLIEGSGIINIQGRVDEVYNHALNYGQNIDQGMADGVTTNNGLVTDSVNTLTEDVKKQVEDNLGIQSPSTVFADYGKNMLLGMLQGLSEQVPTITQFMTELKGLILNHLDALRVGVMSKMGTIVTTFNSGFKMILTVFNQTVPKIVEQSNIIIATMQSLSSSIQTAMSGLSGVSGALASAASSTASTGSLAYANGLPYAPRDMGVRIHQGERILTKDENKDYSNNQNQSSSPMINIENLVLGDIKNQSDANEKARMFVNGLRAQGMEI